MGIYESINMDAVGGGGGGDATIPYSRTFIVGDWVSNGANYDLAVSAATHEKGAQLNIQVYEKDGSDYKEVTVDILASSTGNVTLSVSSSPDLRFEGKIVIIGE